MWTVKLILGDGIEKMLIGERQTEDANEAYGIGMAWCRMEEQGSAELHQERKAEKADGAQYEINTVHLMKRRGEKIEKRTEESVRRVCAYEEVCAGEENMVRVRRRTWAE